MSYFYWYYVYIRWVILVAWNGDWYSDIYMGSSK